ncbi:hypothetical protein [Flavobacterium sp. HTF]|uniref:hypothetical protein n=1 Tax=Flavobacterium sp. HTF TaxID=2170732 RepID=UPI000D5D7498|nr:hypothetical protein [Flavobacterium sp. HTF]PWB28384.1 hypothetical protein DCO46_00295 [Flavobacterium sp. HTF]
MNSVILKEKIFKQASLITKTINYVSIGIVIWILKFPECYNYMLIACLLMPIIGILFVRLSNGIIKIEAKRNSSNPNALPVFLPSLFLAFRIYSDFNIQDYSKMCFPVGIITIVFSAFFLVGDRSYLEIDNWYKVILRIVLFSFIYAFGVVIGFNCVFDKSAPKVFASTVIYKRIQSIGIKSYEIEVSREKKSERMKLSIDGNTYHQLQVGGNVKTYVFTGVFNIPWVDVKD